MTKKEFWDLFDEMRSFCTDDSEKYTSRINAAENYIKSLEEKAEKVWRIPYIPPSRGCSKK